MRTLVFLCGFLSLLTARLYAAACGGSVPCQCGDTVTQNYVMTADLGPCPGHGLLIGNGVTLDGQFHRIIGPGTGVEGYGVYLRNVTGATVKNVIVSGFQRGGRLRDAMLNSIIGSEFVQNGNLTTHVGYGVDAASGARENTLRDNLIHHNADEGIHFGSGSGANIFINNKVFENYRENIYLVSSNDNTLTDNETWGGVNSFYVKDSSFNVFRRNIVRDKVLLVRADSRGNRFLENNFQQTGIHFQVYTKDNPYRFPRDNEVTGGSINDAMIGIRFSSSWGNIIRGVNLTDCGAELLANSDLAPALATTNTAIGVAFSPGKVQLEGDSQLALGWRLQVHVQDAQAAPLPNAHVRAVNAVGAEVFSLNADGNGDILPQEVIASVRTGNQQTSYLPLTVETSKGGYQPDVRLIPLTGNSAVTVTLVDDSHPSNTPPQANAGPDRSVQVGEVVAFDGSLSSNPDTDPLSYAWDFGDGTPEQAGAQVDHVYHAPGVYRVTLSVTDGTATATDDLIVTVQTPPGGASLSDAFDRPNGTTLSSFWLEIQGDLVIAEQKLKNRPERGQHLAVTPLLQGSDQDVVADFTSTEINAWRRFGLLLRYQDSLNYYLIYRQAGAASVLRIAKIVNGQETVLASRSVRNPFKGEVFRLGGRVTGATLVVDLNSEESLSVSDDAFTAGVAGVLLGVGRAVALEADNFSGTVR